MQLVWELIINGSEGLNSGNYFRLTVGNWRITFFYDEINLFYQAYIYQKNTSTNEFEFYDSYNTFTYEESVSKAEKRINYIFTGIELP